MKSLALLCLLAFTLHGQTTSVIGNSGNPKTTTGHVPFLIPGVALDAAGKIYTVHDWDEPHFDIIRWDPLTGHSAWNSGHIIGADLLDCIAVEPDGSVAYVTGWNTAQGGPPYKVDLWKAQINTTPAAVVNFTIGQSVVLTSTSTNPHVPLALSGQDLWLTEQTANLVIEIDKATGSQVSSFSVTNPFGIAIDSAGNLWIGTGTSVSVYSQAGTLLATPITGLTNVSALTIGSSTLYVSDQGASDVQQYAISGTDATFVKTIGYPAQPGQSSGNAIGTLEGIAADAIGDLVLAEYVTPQGASRLRTCNATSAEAVWNAMCTEGQSNVAWSPTTHFLIGGCRSAYDTTGTQQRYWVGTARTDYGSYFGNYLHADAGTCQVITLGGNDFYYYPCGGGDSSSNLAIYRVVPINQGVALQLASCLSQGRPNPYGAMDNAANTYLWSWDDTTGPGLASMNSSTLLGGPDLVINQTPGSGWGWIIVSINVDTNGTIWLATVDRNMGGQVSHPAVWAIPLHGMNAAGNPEYHWADAVCVVNNTVLSAAMNQPPWTYQAPTNVSIASCNYSVVDGLLYVLGVNPSGVSGTWMSGNTLIAFPVTGLNPATASSWSIAMTNYCVGLCPVPLSTGGVITGQNIAPPYGSGQVMRYSKTGAFVASYSPPSTFGAGGVDNPCGAFDTFGPVNASLNPNGSLDVFAEDDYNGRAFWYNLPN